MSGPAAGFVVRGARSARARRAGVAWLLPAVLILAACGNTGRNTARITVGTFWGGNAAEALHRELLTVAREMGTVTVEVRSFTFNGFSEYLFESQPRTSDEALDIFVVPNDWLGRLWQRRIIAEVPPSQVERVGDQLVRQALLTVTDEDHVLGFPVAAEVLALVYDPARFPSPPTTLEEVISTDLPPRVLPLALDIGSPYYLAPLVSSLQGLLVDSAGGLSWRSDILLDTVERLRPAWDQHDAWLVWRGRDIESLQFQLFTEGRLAAFVTGPWLLQALERSGRPFAVVPIPPFANAPYEPRAFLGYQCIAVSRSSPWVDLALEMAGTLCRRDVNERLNRDTRRLPVLLASYQSQRAMATAGTVGFLRALEEGQLFPSEARWGDAFQRASERLQRLAARTSPPDRATVRGILMGERP